MASLLVDGISPDVITGDLHFLFSTYGPLRKVDHLSASRFALVTFELERDAERACKGLQGRDLHGSRLVIDWARGSPSKVSAALAQSALDRASPRRSPSPMKTIASTYSPVRSSSPSHRPAVTSAAATYHSSYGRATSPSPYDNRISSGSPSWLNKQSLRKPDESLGGTFGSRPQTADTSMMSAPQTERTWTNNLDRMSRGGFWSDAYWYDAHLYRRMPLAGPMLKELILAIPALPHGARCCDLASGNGSVAGELLNVYPHANVTLIDADQSRLQIAQQRMQTQLGYSRFRDQVKLVDYRVPCDGRPLLGGPYDLIVASLALHSIVGHNASKTDCVVYYEYLFTSLRRSLKPGGHLIFGDHVGMMRLFPQMRAMERAGFVDVDCAWRQDDMFVAGGRVPLVQLGSTSRADAEAASVTRSPTRVNPDIEARRSMLF